MAQTPDALGAPSYFRLPFRRTAPVWYNGTQQDDAVRTFPLFNPGGPSMVAAAVPYFNVQNIIDTATRACRRNGYPVHDLEFQSAINLAVCKAMKNFSPTGPALITSMATAYALNQCSKVERMMRGWKRQDRAGSEGKAGVYYGELTPTTIPLADFELLSFVARHGRKQAARLLGMRPSRLRQRLDEIALRVAYAVGADPLDDEPPLPAPPEPDGGP